MITVTSFYTNDEIYRACMDRLESSLHRHHSNADIVIDMIEPFGGWLEHVCYKVDFIIKMHDVLDVPFVWIDADAELLRPCLDYFDDFQGVDFGYHKMTMRTKTPTYKPGDVVILGGFLYFGNTPASKKFATVWRDKIKERPEYKFADQGKIELALSDDMITRQIGCEYLYLDPRNVQGQITDMDKRGVKPAVKHHQVSHAYKRWRKDNDGKFITTDREK